MDIFRKHIFPPSLIVTIKYSSSGVFRQDIEKNVLVFVFCCLDGFVMLFFWLQHVEDISCHKEIYNKCEGTHIEHSPIMRQ